MDVKDDKGQSIFEFLIYVPFLLLFMNIMVSISGSINGSINQLKVTRGYFFHIMKGNPMFPGRDDLTQYGGENITRASMFSIGWRAKDIDKHSYLTCYKIKPFALGGLPSEECDKSASDPKQTYLIRVGTMYGACGGDYYGSSPDKFELQMGSPPSCVLAD